MKRQDEELLADVSMSARSKASLVSGEGGKKGGGRIIAENEALVRMLREQTQEIEEESKKIHEHSDTKKRKSRSEFVRDKEGSDLKRETSHTKHRHHSAKKKSRSRHEDRDSDCDESSPGERQTPHRSSHEKLSRQTSKTCHKKSRSSDRRNSLQDSLDSTHDTHRRSRHDSLRSPHQERRKSQHDSLESQRSESRDAPAAVSSRDRKNSTEEDAPPSSQRQAHKSGCLHIVESFYLLVGYVEQRVIGWVVAEVKHVRLLFLEITGSA